MDLAERLAHRRARAETEKAALRRALEDLAAKERRTRERLEALRAQRASTEAALASLERRAAREEQLVVAAFLHEAAADLRRRGAWGEELPLVAALEAKDEETDLLLVVPVPPAVLAENGWERYAGTPQLRAALIAYGLLSLLAAERGGSARLQAEGWQGVLRLRLPLGRLAPSEAAELRTTDLEVLLSEATPPAWAGKEPCRCPRLHWVEAWHLGASPGGSPCA